MSLDRILAEQRSAAAYLAEHGDAPESRDAALGVSDWTHEEVVERHGGEYAGPLKAPFPYFGGKSRVAHLVWERFGNVDNYVEPFAGSLAVLLSRPHPAQTETVNDKDAYLANFWRALAHDPDEVARFADWPVNEADLHARHRWLVNQTEFRERMLTDPDYYDAKIAGWWVWGVSQWIGSGWCSRPEWTGRTNAGRAARGVHGDLSRKRPIIHSGHHGKGVHAKQPGVPSQFGAHRKIPNLGDKGRGVVKQIPLLSSQGNGVHFDASTSALYEYFYTLTARLRRVRVCCGEWTRVLGPSVTVKHGVSAVFLDPPYDMRVAQPDDADGIYAEHDNDVSAAVREWAIANGDNPQLRIAICGYEGEHFGFPPGWDCVAWKAHGGYGLQGSGRGRENAGRERIWFSPHCLAGRQASLFATTAADCIDAGSAPDSVGAGFPTDSAGGKCPSTDCVGGGRE